jgi:hypothetical protein
MLDAGLDPFLWFLVRSGAVAGVGGGVAAVEAEEQAALVVLLLWGEVEG